MHTHDKLLQSLHFLYISDSDLKNKQANNPNKIYRLYLEYYSYLPFCHNKIAIFLSFEIGFLP